jgi:hypothetical protein
LSKIYIPGTWAKKYEQLPQARREAVIRQVNQIFVKRTGITRKLDPKRDTKLVRVWLRIRDAVMSGGASALSSGVGTKVFLWLDGFNGSSKDPRHGGWIEIESAGFPGGAGAGPLGVKKASGGPSRIDVIVNQKKFPKDVASLITLIPDGHIFKRAVLQFSSTQLVVNWNMTSVIITGAQGQGSAFQFTLSPNRIEIESE